MCGSARISKTRWNAWKRRLSAPSTASARRSCASVRWKRASIRASKSSPSRKPDPGIDRGQRCRQRVDAAACACPSHPGSPVGAARFFSRPAGARRYRSVCPEVSGTTRGGASALRARCRVAIFDRGRSRMLLRQAEEGWELPAVDSDSAWFETGDVAARLTESLGIDVFVQRCLGGGENESPATDRLYAGCAITDAVSQDGGRWFGLADLPPLTGPTAP